MVTEVIILGYSIKIILSKRRLLLIKNNTILRTYVIGVGKAHTATPTGNYQIASKIPNPGGPFGVMWLGLSQPHYGIHGTNNPATIGGAVSKGCIRMYNRDVLELSGMVAIGTPVSIEA
ncbi:L,D-transpeptidase [Sporomusa ovata]|uniref:L,D-transpeptidase n=1 Tax=Sporomusa ovata TaxID=2378 RepID=UPI0030D261AC